MLVRWRVFGLIRETMFVIYCWIRLIAIIHSYDDEHTNVLIPVSCWCESPEHIAQNWRIVLLTPESWLFLSINSLTDSVLLQLTMKRPDKNFTVRHIFSLRLNEHQDQFIKLMAQFTLSLPAMRLSCERTNHWVAHGSPVNLAKLTNLLVAQAVSVHIWIFAHS